MKKLISFAIVLCMTMAMATQAFAADPGEMLNSVPNVNVTGTDSAKVTAPNTKGASGYDGSNVQADGASYGEATITSPDDGTNWETVNDDDELDGTADIDGAQINVWATITGAGDAIYKIDIAWGAMKFEFDAGGADWDPETHTYGATSGTAQWVETDYLDGINNRIDVTNHSNSGMTVEFDYAMEGNGTDTLFNANWKSNTDAVVGGFYAENADAITAAGVIDATIDGDGGDTVTNATITGAWLESSIFNGGNDGDMKQNYTATVNAIDLPTAHAFNHGGIGAWASVGGTDNGVYSESGDKDAAHSTGFSTSGNNVVKGGRIKSVYFAFSGEPDAGSSTTLNDFKKVGVITVTVSPNADLTLNSPSV